jgi:hypothetical protein
MLERDEPCSVKALDTAVKIVYTGGMSESLDRYVQITEHRSKVAIHQMHLEVAIAEAHEAGETVTELARWAGVTRPTLYKMIDRGNQSRRQMADPGSGP